MCQVVLSTLRVLTNLTLTFMMRKLRHRESKYFAQGHRGILKQIQDSTPSYVALDTMHLQYYYTTLSETGQLLPPKHILNNRMRS